MGLAVPYFSISLMNTLSNELNSVVFVSLATFLKQSGEATWKPAPTALPLWVQ